jgi:hypothetical protein
MILGGDEEVAELMQVERPLLTRIFSILGFALMVCVHTLYEGVECIYEI